MRSAGAGRAVVVFSGHMIDRAGRTPTRFPASRADDVAAAITRELAAAGAVAGVASGACGGDILFVEAMLARRAGTGGVTVVLPYDADQFVRDSVRPDGIKGGRNWERRFRAILAARRVSVVQAWPRRSADPPADYSRANAVAAGMAALRAAELGAAVIGLAVWDGRAGGGAGGTADAVATWRRLGWATRVIDPVTSARTPIAHKP